MKPCNYTKKGSEIIFHYPFSELRKFIKHGREYGDCGWIFTKAKGYHHTFRGYGTIEHPCKEMITITLQHHELFDGIFEPDKLISKRLKPIYEKESYKLIFLDFNDGSKTL